MYIKPVSNIYYTQYRYNKKKDNEQKNFVDVAEDINKDKKLGRIVDIKI